MKIVVTTRCLNGAQYIERFLHGYDFADVITVSEGGSEDDSVSKFKDDPKVEIVPFGEYEMHDGFKWNPDNRHIQHSIDIALAHNPDIVIMDDLDCWPNFKLREDGRRILEECGRPQINVFRLYMWGDTMFFPKMNKNFDDAYRSLWAWYPSRLEIKADMSKRHGTILGIQNDYCGIDPPYCLLHYSWHPDTIEQKIAKYKAIGMPFYHPLQTAGQPEMLPEWARENE